MNLRYLMLMACSLFFIAGAQATPLDALLREAPRPVLREEYHPTCQRPCEYIGFSFSYPENELQQIERTGANMLTLGAMWDPVNDPAAPYGCGIRLPDGYGLIGQTFIADKSFNGVSPCLPTGTSTDSGCSWRLWTLDENGEKLTQVTSGIWPLVSDNSWVKANFDTQPAGKYLFEIFDATGSWIGWWGRTTNPYPEGEAILGSVKCNVTDLELRLHVNGQWQTIVEPSLDHVSYKLGPLSTNALTRHGIKTNYSVGDWNNPGFPYLPDWFNEKFSEAIALDQNNKPMMAGMFDKSVPAPGIEAPVLVDGASRFIKAVVGNLKDDASLVYWVMGGEAMYATYGAWGRWFDYSDLAIKHFQNWLEAFRYDSIESLNVAWSSSFSAFSEVDPPRSYQSNQAWLDWMDFRFQSMGERFAWHYRAARSEDTKRYIATCNHGSLYANEYYTAMGARPEIYAANGDAFETGQIMGDADSELYNIMYMESINTLGKPYCPARLAYKKTNPLARGGGTSYTPEAARRYVYESLGGDAWHLGLIQWSGSLPDGEWGVVDTPAEPEITKLFGEIRQLWPVLDGMHTMKPKVGVFLSHPVWALTRFQSSWQAFHVAAVEAHLPKLYVYDEQLKSGMADDFSVIACIDNAIIDSGVLQALERFQKQGGRLVIAGHFAIHNPGGLTLDNEIKALRDRVYKNAVKCMQDPEAILKALGSETVPVKITATGSARKIVEQQIAPTAEDWPQDMKEATSLGQTVTVTRSGLRAITIRTPTYYQRPEFGFKFEACLGGPEGEVIASRNVPGGMADNSWQELRLHRSIPAGTVLYLRVTAEASLPKGNIGWWSTKRDIYAEGTAYVNDQPVAGDRQTRLIFYDSVPAATNVETFILSDGLNFGVVLVNTMDEPVELSVDLKKLLLKNAPAKYEITCPLMPDAWIVKEAGGTLSLPANGATMLYAQCEITREIALEWLQKAETAVKLWRDKQAATEYVEYALKAAQDKFNSADTDAAGYAKSAAMALCILRQMGLRVEKTVDDAGLKLVAQCFNTSGEIIPAKAVCEFVPSPAYWQPMVSGSNSSLELYLSKDQLPARWDYAAGRYVSCDGPLRIRIGAKADNLRAQQFVDVVLEKIEIH